MPKPRNANRADKDAYFTPTELCSWCLDQLDTVVSLNGARVLEPSVGSGNFVKAASEYSIDWTTNELFTQYADGFEPTHQGDFKEQVFRDSLGKFDAVIGNPPFGDTASRLAKKFVAWSLDLAPVVGMVLPKGCRRGRFQDSLPDDVKIVQDLELPDSRFITPDGQLKPVGCTWMVFQRVEGYSRPRQLDYEPFGYQCENGGKHPPEWATHGIGLVHNANRFYTLSDDDFSIGSLATFWVELKTEAQIKAFSSLDFSELCARTQTSFPRLTWHEAMTGLNTALRAE